MTQFEIVLVTPLILQMMLTVQSYLADRSGSQYHQTMKSCRNFFLKLILLKSFESKGY